jgi:hypothetical protein
LRTKATEFSFFVSLGSLHAGLQIQRSIYHHKQQKNVSVCAENMFRESID